MGRGRLCAALGVAVLAVVLVGFAGSAGAARRAVTLELKGSGQAFVPGQVVVRFRANVDPLSRRETLSAESASTVKPLGLPGLQLVRVEGSVASAIAALEANPAVAYAEPNWIYHAEAVPNDPRYSQLWGLAKIGAPAAWNRTTGSAGVKVAVVDTGIATDHPDLSANLVPGFDFVQGDSDPRDFNGHGTHVAGTIGARGNNAIGVTGVNWEVSLMPVRVLDGSGSGSNANVAAGFAYACSHGAVIVNASLGGGGYSTAMRDTIASASCANTLFVVAAGNNGENNDATPHYPCSYGAPPDNLANVVCVAATDQNDALANFSNYGQSVDLAAPGVNIPSTWPAYDTLASEGFEDPFANWTTYTAAGLPFGRSTTHAGGVYSATDSPAGTYAANSDTWLYRSTLDGEPRGPGGLRLPTTCGWTRSSITTTSASTAPPTGSTSAGTSGPARLAARSSLSRPTSPPTTAPPRSSRLWPDLRPRQRHRRRWLPRRPGAAVPEGGRRGLQHDQRHVDGDAPRDGRGSAGEGGASVVHGRAAQARDPDRRRPGRLIERQGRDRRQVGRLQGGGLRHLAEAALRRAERDRQETRRR